MQPFLGQLMLFPFGYAPKGWALCAGQIMSVSQNQALFSLLGTTFGGDGISTFALPDLRGRLAIGAGSGPGLQPYNLGQTGGAESVALIPTQMPAHTHSWKATNTAASSNDPTGNLLGATGSYLPSPPDPASSSMNPNELQPSGGSQPHENRPPALTLNWCIALAGIFPSRN